LLGLSVAELTRPQPAAAGGVGGAEPARSASADAREARSSGARPQAEGGAAAAGGAKRATQGGAREARSGGARAQAEGGATGGAERATQGGAPDARSGGARAQAEGADAAADGRGIESAAAEGGGRTPNALPRAEASREAANASEEREGEDELDDTRAPNTTVGWNTPGRFLWAGVEMHAAPLAGLGAAVSFRVRVAQSVAWASAVGGSAATTDIDRGELHVSSLSLRTGAVWLLESSRASVHLGAGVRGRWQRLAGQPSDEASTTRAHFEAWSLGPALFAGATWRLAEPVFVALELEGDHMLRKVEAKVEEGSGKALSPWRASATLGAGVAW
jgi:hypothetical protein